MKFLLKSFAIFHDRDLNILSMVYHMIFHTSQAPYQKHLGFFLDAELTFEEHLKVITNKVRKTIRLLQKLQNLCKASINDYAQTRLIQGNKGMCVVQ